jgi:hypothetical protein
LTPGFHRRGFVEVANHSPLRAGVSRVFVMAICMVILSAARVVAA